MKAFFTHVRLFIRYIKQFPTWHLVVNNLDKYVKNPNQLIFMNQRWTMDSKSYNPLEIFMEPKGVGDEDPELWMWITLPIPNYIPKEGEDLFAGEESLPKWKI